VDLAINEEMGMAWQKGGIRKLREIKEDIRKEGVPSVWARGF
jgi:hypothetical protein